MKILFLDIDGVLNKENTKEKLETVFGPFTGVDNALLKKFLDWYRPIEDEVKIVLSSSWRLDERYEHAFTKYLNELGINWISVTPNLGHRGEEIYQWLQINCQTDEFAILDDISDMHPVGKALVQTSNTKGLEDKHIRKLETILRIKKGKQMNDVTNQMAEAHVALEPAPDAPEAKVKTEFWQAPALTGKAPEGPKESQPEAEQAPPVMV